MNKIFKLTKKPTLVFALMVNEVKCAVNFLNFEIYLKEFASFEFIGNGNFGKTGDGLRIV